MSVIVKYDEWGRMGNRMFQYAFGYLLAQRRQDSFYALGLPNFNIVNTPFYNFKLHDGTSNARHIYTHSYGAQNANLNELISAPADALIIVDSFLQRFDYYKDHLKILRQQFNIFPSPINSNVLVVHIRETDYNDLGLFFGYDYYKRAIKKAGFADVIIVTDNSECEAIQRLISDGCKLYSNGRVDTFSTTCDDRGMGDFYCLLNSENIMISQSSFSWWAAFLGDHKKVIFPYKSNGGMWKYRPGYDDISLFFDSPSNIIYYE